MRPFVVTRDRVILDWDGKEIARFDSLAEKGVEKITAYVIDCDRDDPYFRERLELLTQQLAELHAADEDVADAPDDEDGDDA
jgi:hypothetical protein